MLTYFYNNKFTFYNNKSNLVCNLVMYMLALAFANNTFKNDFTSFKNIYKLIILSKTDYICLY
jgi:hypothetical protein